MKKLMMLLVIACMTLQMTGQEKLYLLFEFMKVDNEQEAAYMETEKFWSKIHEERIKNGDIIGWDLWRLQPGGESQHFQYMTVNLYDDPVKMMSSAGDFNAALKAAYPDMSDEQLDEKFNMTTKSRDLAVRIYLEEIDSTDDEFEMPLGTVAAINMMKAEPGQNGKYEKMESEVFKPLHQRDVNSGVRGSWGLLRFMAPYGSDVYASHIAVDMFKDYDQYFNPPKTDHPELTEEQIKQINDGIATRDLKYMYLGTLIMKKR